MTQLKTSRAIAHLVAEASISSPSPINSLHFVEQEDDARFDAML